MDCISNCFPFSSKGVEIPASPPDSVFEKASLDPHSDCFAIQTPMFNPYSDDPVEELLDILRTSDLTGEDLRERLRSVATTTSWTGDMAERIMHGIEDMVISGVKVGGAMEDAITTATDTAREFAQQHPYYAALIAAGTVVALGVLAYVGLAWVLEYIGFEAVGPRAGSFAAQWMSRIALEEGGVSKGSIYAYLQSLGMTWL